MSFAAFYADCEHAIKPITKGSRVCLTYNLLQRRIGKKNKSITAPLYDSEANRAETILERTFKKSNAPVKLAWLLEHQYSPAGLSFSGLKGRDAALAQVLRHSAQRAGCVLHLGIVHIEESGAAEPRFDMDYGRSRRWRRHYDDDDMIEGAESGDDEFEVIEVFDSSRQIDQWIDTNDHAVEFGSLPIEDCEILPAGALDGEAPDQQRLTEASGMKARASSVPTIALLWSSGLRIILWTCCFRLARLLRCPTSKIGFKPRIPRWRKSRIDRRCIPLRSGLLPSGKPPEMTVIEIAARSWTEAK